MLLRLFLATVCLLGSFNAVQAAITSTGNVQPTNPAAWDRYTTIGIVGGSEYGAMTVNSGSGVSSGSVYFGLSSGGPSYYGVGVGTITGNGSTLDSSMIFVGYEAYGNLNIMAGGAVSDLRGYIGYDVGSTGTVTVNGSGSTWTNTKDFFVGLAGRGTLDIVDGGHVCNTNYSGDSDIGCFAGSTGMATVAGAGSTWAVNGTLGVGRFGEGKLNITGGGVVSDASGFIGENFGSIGMATVAGVGSTWTNSGRLDIGTYGRGTLNVSGGGSVINTYSIVGGDSGATGVVTVDGNGSTWTASGGIGVGISGNGILNITHGGAVTAEFIAINNRSWLAIDTNSSLNVVDRFTNNGLVLISAAANALAGTYTPIDAGGWFGNGTYQALGGTWNANGSHQFIVSAAQTGTSGQTVTMDPSIAPRVVFTDMSGWSVGASFAATDGSTLLNFAATAISGDTLTTLEDLLGENQILGGWEFEADDGYSQGDPVYLSFNVGGGFSPSDLLVWHYTENSWSQYTPTDLSYDGTYASFTVNGFSGYAVTTVPEPGTLSLLGILGVCLGGLGLFAFARRRKKSRLLILILAVAAISASGSKSAQAAYSLVTSRSGPALSGGDSLNWSAVGGVGAVIGSGFTRNSLHGVPITVSQTTGSPFVVKQQSYNWNGNFAPSDYLLHNTIYGSGGIVTLNFNGTGVSAGGLQIQSSYYGQFTARIQAFDAGANLLASFDEIGYSNGYSDNSAIFLGIASSTANIRQIKISVPTASGAPNDYAVNRLSFKTTAPDYYLINSRSDAALSPSDVLDWSSAGGVGATIGSGFSVDTLDGVPVTVFQTTGAPLQVRRQGVDWQGNFAPGDHLLYNSVAGSGSGGAITLNLGAAGLTAGGVQIQPLASGQFNAHIEAFDVNNSLLAAFDEIGNSNANANNSAIFLGIGSNVGATIHKLRISTNNPNFAINQLSISPVPVPEPGTLSLLGIFGVCLGGYAWRKRRRARV